MPYTVQLTYFKESGKYYSDGEYKSHKEHLFEIRDEVRQMSKLKQLPGLIEGHDDYYIVVDVPNHPHDHPHLVKPQPSTSTLPTFDRVAQQG